MKRWILIPLIFILTGSIVIGWLYWRDIKSYDNTIPDQAKTVLKIRIDQLIRNSIIENILDPAEWFRKRDSTIISISERKGSGISIPANLFIFNLEEIPGSWFTILTIKDDELASQFLQDRMKMTKTDSSYYTNNRNLEAAMVKNRLLIGYCPRDSKTQLSQLINNIDLYFGTPSAEWNDRLKTNTKDLSLLSERAEIELEKEGINITFDFTLDKSKQSLQDLFRHLGVPLSETGMKFLPDNISEPLEVNISGSVLIKDTILTYEYDDNFQKMERFTVRERYVPGVKIVTKDDRLFPLEFLNETLGIRRKFEFKELQILSNLDSVKWNLHFPDSSWLLQVDFRHLNIDALPFDSQKFFKGFSLLKLEMQQDQNRITGHGKIKLTKKYF